MPVNYKRTSENYFESKQITKKQETDFINSEEAATTSIEEFINKEGANVRYSLDELINFYLDKLPKVEITPQQKQEALQLYSQYLDSVFPDSQVKDIVYHGTRRTEKSFEKRIPDDAYGSNAIYFADKKYAETFGNLIPSLLNITAPLTSELKFNRRRLKPGFISPAGTVDARDLLRKNSNNDGLIGVDYSDTENSTYVVKEPEQIHILGSKQDIDGFKEFAKSGKQIEKSVSLQDKVNTLIQEGKATKFCK